MQMPAQWTAPGAGAGAARRQLARGVPRRSAERGGRRSHRPQRRPARGRGACRAGAAPRQACGREAVAVGRSPRAWRRQAVRRRLGHPGRRPLRDLGGRPLGPRALRPGGERRSSRVGAGGLRVRATVDCGARGQELVPRHRGGLQIEAARETIRASEELVRLADDRRASGSAVKRMCSWRAPASGAIATSCASSSSDASRRFERSSSCSAGTPRPQRRPSPQLPGFRGEVPAGLPSAASGAATGRGRRGAARSGRVQSDWARPRRPACRRSL